MNGNLTANTNNTDSKNYYWDESNRLRVATDDQGSMQHYIYDASGERVLKANSNYTATYENGSLITPSTVNFNSYTTYPSAFVVVNPDGITSKHYYAGTQKVASRLQYATIIPLPISKQTNNDKKPSDDTALQQAQIEDLQMYMDLAGKGKVTFREAPQQEIATNTANRQSQKTSDGVEGVYFYHPDHLGTSTFLTDQNGVAYQFFLNLPFGETMAEQKGSGYYQNAYKFNGKELDDETGLYYYGARYYSPRESIWLSVDSLAERHPDENPYIYCRNNPIVFIDPDGNDRIYSASGRFIEDTGKGNLIKVNIGNKSYKLSQLAYNKGGTNRAVSKIIAHEAYLKGYKGKYGLSNSKKGGAYTDGEKNVRVVINEIKRGVYDDFHTLGSVIGHEADLEYGHKGENIPQNKYTYLNHANVYLGQSLEADFKNTSESNQYTVAVGFATRVFATTQKEQGLNVDDLIAQFNKNNGTVKIEGINTNTGNASIILNGQSNTIKLEIPTKPQD